MLSVCPPQMTDFSDSSQSSMLSPASTLIESFNKKSGSPLPSQLSSQHSSQPSGASGNTLCTVTPTLNGSVANGGAGGATGAGTTVATLGGRQINTSSSSCSSLKETSHQSTSTSQQVSRGTIQYEYYTYAALSRFLRVDIYL